MKWYNEHNDDILTILCDLCENMIPAVQCNVSKHYGFYEQNYDICVECFNQIPRVIKKCSLCNTESYIKDKNKSYHHFDVYHKSKRETYTIPYKV